MRRNKLTPRMQESMLRLGRERFEEAGDPVEVLVGRLPVEHAPEPEVWFAVMRSEGDAMVLSWIEDGWGEQDPAAADHIAGLIAWREMRWTPDGG